MRTFLPPSLFVLSRPQSPLTRLLTSLFSLSYDRLSGYLRIPPLKALLDAS